MAKAIWIGHADALDVQTREVRPLDVSVVTDEAGEFSVMVGGAQLDAATAGYLARHLMAAAAKAATLTLMGSVSA